MKRKTAYPPNDLYIYVCRGLVPEEREPELGEAFLGNWWEDDSSFLFFSEPSREKVCSVLDKGWGAALIDEYHLTYNEWQGGGLEVMRIPPFLIAPPWEDVEGVFGEMEIVLDPGVVFGTGLHPTTRDCLKAVVYVSRREPLGRVLDLGTGTGILALAAARLGAGRVEAVDLNPLCVKTAKRNVALNGLEGIIEISRGDAIALGGEPADLLVANMHQGAILDLVREGGLNNKRWGVLSGLMRSAARDIKGEMGKWGLNVVREWDHEMIWYTMLVAGGAMGV